MTSEVFKDKLPGRVLNQIVDLSKFEDKKWYSIDKTYKLSGAIIYGIWLDIDKPLDIIYIWFQSYDHHSYDRELIKVSVKTGYIIYSNYSSAELDEMFN